MKKTLCLLLSLLLLAALSACTDKNDNSAGYVFSVGDVKIELDAAAEPILSALGEPKQYSESPSCAFEGLDKVYVYAGFQIQTYPQGGKDYILSVELTDDLHTTAEGVAIGASRDRVVEVYGTPAKESATALIYRDEAKGHNLQFLLRDGKVTNIQYLKTEA